MILGGIGVFLRSLPVRLWGWMVSQSTMIITIKDDDEAFQWVKEWFLPSPARESRSCRASRDR